MTVNVGIIGLGIMGADHANIIQSKVSNAKVTSIYDKNINQAQRIIETLDNPEIHNSGLELINSNKVDAVMVVSPDDSHVEFVLESIKLNKPVLCEKPLSHSVKECNDVIEAEQKIGKRLVQVGFMRRFCPTYQEMKKNYNNLDVGKALLLHCVHRMVSAPSYFESVMSIRSALVHEFDIIRWLLETEIVEIQIIKSSIRKDLDFVDPIMAIIKCANGAIVDVEVNANAKYGYDVRAELVCEKGTILMSPSRKNELLMNNEHSFSYGKDWRPRFADAYRNQNQAWINSILNNTTSEGSSAWDGMVSSFIADKGVQAFEEEKTVTIPVKEKPNFYN